MQVADALDDPNDRKWVEQLAAMVMAKEEQEQGVRRVGEPTARP